jgi:hypothetical protein
VNRSERLVIGNASSRISREVSSWGSTDGHGYKVRNHASRRNACQCVEEHDGTQHGIANPVSPPAEPGGKRLIRLFFNPDFQYTIPIIRGYRIRLDLGGEENLFIIASMAIHSLDLQYISL